MNTRRRRTGYTLTETLVALGVFALGSLGIWQCISATFFLTAKNTGLNLSHASLQNAVDTLADRLRASMQLIDIATFDGTTFTHVNESVATGPSAAGNAVRFLRVLPVAVFMLPDDGALYTETNPQNPYSPLYPDYLTASNTHVKAAFTPPGVSVATKEFALDLKHARLFPRFPYLSENVVAGNNPGTKPGLALSSVPLLVASPEVLNLTNGLPATARTVPSCNQAYLVIESAAVVLNRSTYSEMIYYPDANDLTRKTSLTTGLGVSTTGAGPNAFALLKTAGALTDPAARNSLCVTLPVYPPYLDSAVTRRGGASSLINIELTLPVEIRRRALF